MAGFATHHRTLLEAVAPERGPALKVDAEKGIIYRVRVLGRFSKNRHHHEQATGGTEYSRACQEGACPLYEDISVKIDHPENRAKPATARSARSLFGKLRQNRVELDGSGDSCGYADLHYLTTHPMAPSVVEDVQKGLGVFGLSHNADGGTERFDQSSKRLVIESLSKVRSVDLVDNAANRTLWESLDTDMITRRQLLETEAAALPPARQRWLRHLLEDASMASTLDSPMDGDGAGDKPAAGEALWAGIKDEIGGVLEAYKTSGDDAAAMSQIKKLISAHKKCSQEKEPAADEPMEEKAKGKEITESLNAEAVELATFRGERDARVLCESLDHKAPTPLQLRSLIGLPDEADRRSLIESFKATPTAPGKRPAGGFAPPRSSAPGGANKTGGGRPTPEAKDPAADLAMLNRN